MRGGLAAVAVAMVLGAACTDSKCPEASLRVALPPGHPDINQAQMCLDGQCGTALVLGAEVFGTVPDTTSGKTKVEVLLIVANHQPISYAGNVQIGRTSGCAVPPDVRATADGRIVAGSGS